MLNVCLLIQQADFDTLTTSLRMDAVYVKDNMHIKWASETGFVENIAKVVKEYRESRRLTVSCCYYYYCCCFKKNVL
jgi:hypothetical protein